jgi:hypothetical protein
LGIYGGEPRAARHGGGDSTSARAPTALSEALTELRRLTQDSLFDGLERALADLGNAPIGSDFGMDTVRKLRHWSSEHQRVAVELEAAARCCRLVEREMNQRVDALLEVSAARTRWRTGQLREIFRRGRVGTRPVAESAEPVAPSLSQCPRRRDP